MYEHQHGALFILALATGAIACRLFDSSPIKARDPLKPARRNSGRRA